MKLIKLTFSGDIMLKSKLIQKHRVSDNEYNFDSMFSEINNFLSKSDFVVGNLETPITDKYSDIKYESYRFTSPIDFAKSVKKAGFDFVTTANNHCLDNGIDGIKTTIDCLNEIGIEHTGISYNKELLPLENISDIKIAILSYTYGTNAFSNNVYLGKEDRKKNKVNLFQNQELSNKITRKLYKNDNFICKNIKRLLRKLKLFQLNKPAYEREEKNRKQREEITRKIEECKQQGADYIIMCMHEGGQYNKKPLKKTKKTVKFLKDNGIDLIVGNHEHVINKIEWKDDNLTAYSLGNFIGTAGVIEEPFDKMSEYSILLNVYLSKTSNKVKLEKATFTILKTVINNGQDNSSIKVKLLYDLINECKDKTEKEKLIADNQKIVEIVTENEVSNEEVKKEYDIKRYVSD